ncbi:hypothetical protein ALO83_200005 [Pseudomonas cannabina pv. alisalensis]|nr:hypothetical protein ALO83_200005 [Pseudomonas cannabina pv. alisalensis]RMN75852.1 hypothetical protein ALQ52_200050 [Pseudomonas cannabina pv. alisalensis]
MATQGGREGYPSDGLADLSPPLTKCIEVKRKNPPLGGFFLGVKRTRCSKGLKGQ